ncbi:MAG: hypothetical protein ABIQ61_00430 [Ornithinibacter sp.]
MAIVAVAAPLDWWSVLRGRPAIERCAKPAVLVALIGSAEAPAHCDTLWS